MSDEIDDFLRDLNQEVAATAVASGDYTRSALVENLTRRLIEAEEIQDWTPAFFEGRGLRRRLLGVDGYCVDELTLDGTLQVIVSEPKTSEAPVTLTTAEVNGAFDRALAFVSEAMDGRLHETLEPSRPAADLATLIYESRDLIRTVRVLLVSNGAVGSRYKMVERTTLGDVKVELHIWDLVRFQRLAGTGGREEIDIDVQSLMDGGIPALPAGLGDAQYRAYLCVVPGKFLADVYELYGSRILEGNVRAFLSVRGKVNKGIRKTVLTQPDRFFAFNNGITATASQVEIGPEGTITKIVDLQIVNGGQTTASLFNTRFNDKASLDGIFVQMKLSVLPSEVATVMIPEISRYANTQNKVSDADLFANHPFNRKVEELSRRIWAPPRAGSHQMTHWFYERARAQYQTEQIKLSVAGKKAFLLQNPKDQLITKTDLAKYENSYGMQPHIVSHGAQKNFMRYAEAACGSFDASPENFNERWFQHLVAKAILFARTEKIVSAASWYTRAYRANIVTYGIAKLIHMIEDRFPHAVLDLDQIWKTQDLSEAVSLQLELTAKAAQDVLLAPPQEGANVTEWAKKRECWQRVAATMVETIPDFTMALKDRGDERDDRRDARREEREENTISATMEVVQRSQSGFWGRAVEWRRLRSVLSPTESGIVETAASRGDSWVPTDAQAKRLLDAARKLEEDGLT